MTKSLPGQSGVRIVTAKQRSATSVVVRPNGIGIVGSHPGRCSTRLVVLLKFGEMAEELLLAGTRVAPRKLLDSGYQYRDPDLAGALRRLLGRDKAVDSPLAALGTEADPDGQ
jgi:hypothetical protein